MLLVVPIVWLLLHGEYLLTLVVFFVAALTDGLDGFLAKRFDWRSKLGGLLDPLADKLLLVSSFATLAFIGLAPVWLFVAVTARDLIIVSGATAYRLLIGPFAARPTAISKANSALQLLYVLLAVTYGAFGWPGQTLVDSLIWAVLATTVLSGVDYMYTWGIRAWQVTR
jgi:cardiolipin synthase